MSIKSKKQALFFLKKAKEVAEESKAEKAVEALGPLISRLEKKVLQEES